MIRALALSLLLASPSPPAQPPSGPGGRDYHHAKVVEATYGQGTRQYWLFEPAEPKPASAPVVVFNHGWMGLHPAIYLGWIRHIVRRGNIVVFPKYQNGPLTPPREFAPNAIAAVKDALERLRGGDHVRPDASRFALVGHSAGGAIAADMAALAAEAGLPVPKAVMVVQPGRGLGGRRSPFFPAADLRKIPPQTYMLVVVGDEDRVVRRTEARKIFYGASRVPPERKDFVVVRSDRHGQPPLVADHFSPCSFLGPRRRRPSAGSDALDFYAYWKLFDALTDLAFYGKSRAFALGNTPQQRFMGLWSDGVPVAELLVTDKP